MENIDLQAAKMLGYQLESRYPDDPNNEIYYKITDSPFKLLATPSQVKMWKLITKMIEVLEQCKKSLIFYDDCGGSWDFGAEAQRSITKIEELYEFNTRNNRPGEIRGQSGDSDS